MPNVDYQQVKELFFAAVDLECGQREAFLVQACAGEEPLMAEVRSLLRSWSEAPNFLDQPALEPAPATGRDGIADSAFDLRFLLRHWHRYELEECLGVGGQSLVYRATDRRWRRSVAVKLLTRPDRRAVTRFRCEAESLARIAHPAVLEPYETGVVDGIPYLAMQLVNGPSLMGVRAATSLEQRVELIRQVAWGLQAAHDLGIVHRDVKPANILVERAGDGAWRSYLADFGIARAHDGARVTQTGALVGTLSYLAPERLRRPARELDHRSDVYALGVTFYEFLTGCSPHAASSTVETLLRIRDGIIEPPRREMPELSPRLEAILMRCLAIEPDARYPSAGALAEDLERFLDGESVRAPSVSGSSRCRERKLGSVLGLAGRAAALLAAATALWLVTAGPVHHFGNGSPGRA